jgi:hypothetical protein
MNKLGESGLKMAESTAIPNGGKLIEGQDTPSSNAILNPVFATPLRYTWEQICEGDSGKEAGSMNQGLEIVGVKVKLNKEKELDRRYYGHVYLPSFHSNPLAPPSASKKTSACSSPNAENSTSNATSTPSSSNVSLAPGSPVASSTTSAKNTPCPS